MEIKELYRSALHENQKSHDVRIISIGDKKVKMTYESYPGNEKLTVTALIEGEWKHQASMLDLGVLDETTMYATMEKKRKERANTLFQKSDELLKIMYS